MLKRVLWLGLLAATVGPSAAATNLDGTYEVRWMEPKSTKLQRQDPATTPPGQMRRFVGRGDRCALYDMMVGFAGKVRQLKGEAIVTWLEGPSGKLAKPQTLRFSIASARGAPVLTQIAPPSKERLVLVRTSTAAPTKFPV